MPWRMSYWDLGWLNGWYNRFLIHLLWNRDVLLLCLNSLGILIFPGKSWLKFYFVCLLKREILNWNKRIEVFCWNVLTEQKMRRAMIIWEHSSSKKSQKSMLKSLSQWVEDPSQWKNPRGSPKLKQNIKRGDSGRLLRWEKLTSRELWDSQSPQLKWGLLNKVDIDWEARSQILRK